MEMEGYEKTKQRKKEKNENANAVRLTCVDTTLTKSFSERNVWSDTTSSSSANWSRPASTERYLQFDVVLVRLVDADDTASCSWHPTISGESTKNKNIINPTTPMIIAGTINELAQLAST